MDVSLELNTNTNNSITKVNKKKYMLSLDGGGVKTLFQLSFLEYLQKKYNYNYVDMFDIFTGVSAGAITICALIVPDETGTQPKFKTIHEIRNLMTSCLFDVFNNSKKRLSMITQLFVPIYNTDTLRKNLSKFFGNLRMKDLLKDVYIPSYDVLSNRTIIFNKKEHPNVLILDVLMSTTAAPIMFYSHKLTIDDTPYEFLDGGFSSNISCDCVITKLFKDDKNTIFNLHILSISSGYKKTKNSNYRGVLSWIGSIINVMYESNISSRLDMINDIMENKFFRVGFTPDYDIRLDDVSVETMDYLYKKGNEFAEIYEKVINDFLNVSINNDDKDIIINNYNSDNSDNSDIINVDSINNNNSIDNKYNNNKLFKIPEEENENSYN